MKRALVTLVAAVAFASAGCGSGAGSGTPGDPAKLAPATAIGFASFELAPQGAEKQGFDAAFGKLLGPDPENRIARALTDAAKEEGSKLDYASDVKPWLGRTAAAVLTNVTDDHADYALLLASTDDDKARAAIAKDLTGENARSRSYRGVDYKVISGGIANGVLDHYLVAGTESAFKAIVDATQNHKSLADTKSWQDSVADRGAGKIGLGYFDLKALITSAASGAPGLGRLVAPLALALVDLHPFVATLDANADSLVLEVSSPGTPAGKITRTSSPLIETLPGDSWLAAGLPQVGFLGKQVLAGLKLNPLVGATLARYAAQLREQTGLDVERDLLAGIGDVAAFAHGASERSWGGGLVVAAADRAALARTLARLPRVLRLVHDVRVRNARGGFDVGVPELPRAIEVRGGGPGAVATYGPPRAALAPPTRLGSSALFRRAAASLGTRPTLFVALAPLIDLMRASGHHHELSAQDAERLRHADYVAVGIRRDQGSDVIRAVLGLH